MTLPKTIKQFSTALAIALPLATFFAASPAMAIDFGDNSSEWANDGECDDPRFGGAGVADILLDEDMGRDANDCQRLLSKGQIHILPVGKNSGGNSGGNSGIDFGNDTSEWANDGECDDPRFSGPGVADILLDEDMGRDATDCRTLLQQGQIQYSGSSNSGGSAGIDFGDNSSEWANDGECDDPRFGGAGVADILLDEDMGHDANDCRTLLDQGQIQILSGGSTNNNGINFGDNSSTWANDDECDDPRFSGPGVSGVLLDEDLGHDANDCRALLQQGRIQFDG